MLVNFCKRSATGQVKRGFALRETAYCDYHTSKLKAKKMIEFAGWSMPAFYDGYGIIKEHMACREEAAFFDVSHMGQIK
jgi:aminomethyltransferase